MSAEDLADSVEREAAALQDPPPHYELNDLTCVTCGQPWMCATAAMSPIPRWRGDA